MGFPAPLPELASFVRRMAGGDVAAVPAGLPDELRQSLEQLRAAIRERGHS